ncbi:ATP-dependent zinc protease [Candidatus Saccharibacteria bacterium]|nr:ATP-dependent zinc protease [Candidatus Saccharibacteria bacterium]
MKNLSDNNTLTIGAFESVSLPALNMENIIAKVDTGAYSGAVHCTLIKIIRRKLDGVKVLHFVPSGNHQGVIELEKYKVTNVRSSSGHRLKRYLIETDIIIRNKRYTVSIGLSDRSDMQREVLIGRRFLRQNGILVDVRINQELDNDGGEKI